MVITTTDADGVANDRVVARLESNNQLYVAANHWPRAWYRHARANPHVQATVAGEQGDYLAVPVTGAEHDQLLGFFAQIRLGVFVPRVLETKTDLLTV